MAKVLVLYYSAYGHIEAMANAVAEGARAAGAEVDVKRVPETAPEEIAKAAHFKLDQAAPIAQIADLEHYDAIVVGTGTRFGRIASQMAAFLDQAGGLWARGVLNGKVGAAFTSSATQHGGNETTLFSIIANLLHFGMIIVGLPYSHAGQMTLDEIVGIAPAQCHRTCRCAASRRNRRKHRQEDFRLSRRGAGWGSAGNAHAAIARHASMKARALRPTSAGEAPGV
jgi:NAD(P)H dehydrogenase (quinone)